MMISSLFKSLYFFGLALLMLTVSAVEVRAQDKVYASSYGWEESGTGLLGLTHGFVQNRANGISSNSLATRLSILALLNSSDYAHYQLKFQTDLPGGTPVYIQVAANIGGLLGLLEGKGLTSVYRGSSSNDTNAITGIQLGSNQYELDTATISNSFFIIVTPLQSFNAIKISLTQEALKLLGILTINLGSLGYIDVYNAYYECPTFAITHSEPLCSGHPFELTVSNPISTGTYTWHNQASGGFQLTSGLTMQRTEATHGSKTYYLKHSQFSSSCPGAPVSVNVGAIPDNPTVTLE